MARPAGLARSGRLGIARTAQEDNLSRLRDCRAVGDRPHLRQLLDLLGDEAFSGKYRGSSGICIPHFLVAEENNAAHPHFADLRELQLHAAQALHDTLDRFTEKHDHRAREEITPAEARAWIDAMEFLGGKRGVFGSEMRRPASLRLPEIYKQ